MNIKTEYASAKNIIRDGGQKSNRKSEKYSEKPLEVKCVN